MKGGRTSRFEDFKEVEEVVGEKEVLAGKKTRHREEVLEDIKAFDACFAKMLMRLTGDPRAKRGKRIERNQW